MNSERKKAVLTLTGTLIIGILIGMLVPALFHKVRERGRERGGEEGRGHDERGREERGDHGRGPENKKDWFSGTIYRIVQPDSNQVKQIKPITEWAAHKIDSLETSSNEGLASVLDSVKTKLKPIISEEQFKRLDEFDSKAKGHWRDKGRGRH